MSFGFFGPELMATLFQPNPRSEVRLKDPNEQAFKYRNLDSFVNPTPLAHADTSRDVLSRGGTSQFVKLDTYSGVVFVS
ncbi:hypothetical protein TNCV_2722201 [Trichonephila clavipes]|nr:hypothetical protein TNCV_2722201 [Trichonephila clavipes]